MMESLVFIIKLTLFTIFYYNSVNGVTVDNRGCPKNLPDTTTVRVFQDKCYQFVSDEKYWTDARDYCWEYGGGLVMVNTREVNGFVTGVVNSLSSWRNNGIWIGLNDKQYELDWKWVTHNRYNTIPLDTSWTNWAPGHPESFLHGMEDCVRMVRDYNWRWKETYCSTLKWQYRFICEYDQKLPTTTATTIIKIDEPRVGEVIGNQPDKTSKTETRQELDSGITSQEDINTIVTDQKILLTTVITDVAKEKLSASARESERQTVAKIGIIAGVVGAILLILALICVTVVGRCRNKRRSKESSPEEIPVYEVAKDPEGCEGEMTSEPIQARQNNLYTDTDHPDSGKLLDNDGGYLEPKSLVKTQLLKDGYLTTAEAKNNAEGNEYVSPSGGIHNPGLLAPNCSNDAVKMASLPGYLPMNGSAERLNGKGGKCCQGGSPITADYVNDVIEPVYAEISEVPSDNQKKL